MPETRRPIGRPRRADQRVPTRDLIVQAAMALFMARGYRTVTMDMVAEAAGVSKPAVYYHFRDKGSLLVAVAAMVFGRARDATATVLAANAPLRRRFEHIAEIVLALPQPFTAFDGVMHEAEIDLTPEQVAGIRQAEHGVFHLLEMTIRDAVAQGLIRTEDPVLLAHAFVALLRVGQSRDAQGERIFPDVPRTAARLVALLWEGIGPRGARE